MTDIPSTSQGDSPSADVNTLSLASESQLTAVVWPKGGHNYYFRDMEKAQREMRWLELDTHGEANWQERYMAKLKAWEDKWGK